MLKIFVCEDNEEQRLKFEKMISNIIMIENYDMNLQLSCSDPYEVLDYIK